MKSNNSLPETQLESCMGDTSELTIKNLRKETAKLDKPQSYLGSFLTRL